MEASQIQHGEPRRLVMSAPTPLRQNFDAPQVRGLARKTKDGPQARRLLALAAIYDGATRTEAAKIGGVGLQIIRDWVLRFNARGPDGLLDGKSTGQPSKLNDTQRQAIAGMIESGPIPAVHGVVRWRLIDLAQWIFEEFRITIAKQTLSRELRAMGYRKLSARPRHHAQAAGAIEDFKKNFPARLEAIARKKALDRDTIEIWFADEARIGQKNKITRRWAKRGTRPSAPRDQRTASTYIFGAVCPKEGKGAALIMPACNTEARTCTSPRSPQPSRPLPTPSSWSIKPAGTCPPASSCRPISQSFCCRRSAQSSTRSRTSGSSCATTGSPTASSNPTTISSTIVVRHGTSSSISLGASCPSDCANGPTGSDQWDLVLRARMYQQGKFLTADIELIQGSKTFTPKPPT